MVLMPEFKDEIIPFAKLALDLGVDYGVIKHCSDDELGTIGVDYSKYEDMYELLKKAEAMSNDKTKVIVKWSKIKRKGKPTYNRFYGPQFLLQISGSGLVAPSGMFFNARYSKLHMGNFVDERFKDIFKSERYRKIMNYLASPNFDAQTMMGSMPIQHYVSEALDNHLKGISKISPQKVKNLFTLISYRQMLSVVIPCFNEETLVKKSFTEIFKALKDSKIIQYEIIF